MNCVPADSGKEEVIVVGGFYGHRHSPKEQPLASVHIYSIEESRWRSAKPFPMPIANATVVPYGDSLLLVGGQTVNLRSLSTIHQYNQDEDSWTLLDARIEEEKSRGEIHHIVIRTLAVF